MKLQTRTMLALYSIIEAASHPDTLIPATEIADRYGVSTHHLAKVLRELGRAGFVDSLRGVGGGYRFSGNSRRITLLDVIGHFEDISVHAPETTELHSDIGRAIELVLSEIDGIAKATLGSITIDTLLKVVAKERERSAAAK